MYLLICDLQVEDEAQVDQDNEQDETKVRLYYCLLIPQNPCVNNFFSGLICAAQSLEEGKSEQFQSRTMHCTPYFLQLINQYKYFFKFSVFDFNYSR